MITSKKCHMVCGQEIPCDIHGVRGEMSPVNVIESSLIVRLERLLDVFERNLVPIGIEALVPPVTNNIPGTVDVAIDVVEGIILHGFGFGPLLPEDAAQLGVCNVQLGRKIFHESGESSFHDPVYRHLFLDRKTGQGVPVFPRGSSRNTLIHRRDGALVPAAPGLITVRNHSIRQIAIRGCAYGECMTDHDVAEYDRRTA